MPRTSLSTLLQASMSTFFSTYTPVEPLVMTGASSGQITADFSDILATISPFIDDTPSLPDDEPLMPMSIDDFFNAILTANIGAIRNWYKVKISNFIPFEEAGLDLAKRLADLHPESRLLYDEIADIIATQLQDEYARMQSETHQPFVKLHSHTFLAFDRTYVFGSIRLETYRDGTIMLRINYKTKLQYPFIRNALLDFTGRETLNSIAFDYHIAHQSEADIVTDLAHIFCALIRLHNQDSKPIDFTVFSPFIFAIENFFHDMQQGLPEPYMVTSAFNYTPSNTYFAYELYLAACHADPNLMLCLLRGDADPNLRFDRETILYYAILIGTRTVFAKDSSYSIEEGTERLLKTIKLLIKYGANPCIENDSGETMMEFLVTESMHVKPEIAHLYQTIFTLLLGSNKARPHILVHPEALATIPIANTVADANQEMVRRWHRGPSIFAASQQNLNSTTLLLHMGNGKRLKIESVKVAQLNEHRYEELFAFFAAHPALEIRGSTPQVTCSSSSSSSPDDTANQISHKRDYFDSLMRIVNSGTIDIISDSRGIQGFIMSKFIHGTVAGKPATVYFPKFGLAHPSLHSGLITALIWLRGFTYRQYLPQDTTLFCYYDAASASGFLGAQMMQRFPTSSQLNSVMPELISMAHSDADAPTMHEGCYYRPAKIKIAEKGYASSLRWQTPATIESIMHQEFALDGQLLAVAFLMDSDNFHALEEFLRPMMSATTLSALLTFYREQTLQEVSHQTAMSLRARL